MIARPCAYCSDHSVLDGPASHVVCDECEKVMDRAVDRDASDRDLVLIAVSAYGAARYEAAVRACAETYDRMDRAHRRVIRLLDRALEPKRSRTSDGCRHPFQGAEDAGASSDEAHEHPGEGPARPSAHPYNERPGRKPSHRTVDDGPGHAIGAPVQVEDTRRSA